MLPVAPAMPTPRPPCTVAPSDAECADAALVHAAREGNPRACFLLWSKYSAFVARLVRRFLGPGPDHADVCQEIFLRLFRRLGDVREPAALRGFVVSVTLGVCRNEVRKRRIRSIIGPLPDETAAGATPSAPAEAREATRALYQMLATLGAEDRSLFVARFVEKMEIVEVAAAHAMSISTAKRRVARLVARVNKRVQANPVLREYLEANVEGGTP